MSDAVECFSPGPERKVIAMRVNTLLEELGKPGGEVLHVHDENPWKSLDRAPV